MPPLVLENSDFEHRNSPSQGGTFRGCAAFSSEGQSVDRGLAGGEAWRRLWTAALTTSLMWIGLGVFASFYFSSTIVSDSKTYGAIGVVFTLVTWFIAMGAVLTLGAVVGVLWERRREMHRQAD